MSISNAICFLVGGALGSLATWYVVKDKYARIAQEEINSVKDIWERDGERLKKQEKELNEIDREEKANEINNYAKKVEGYGYSDISKAQTTRWQDSNHDPRVPYIVSPMDFEDTAYAHYERIEMTYYADGVLANSRDEIITVQESYESIGPDIYRNVRDHFGEYEEDPDIVYVRNESTFTQYEITRDNRTYAQCIGRVIE